MAHLKPSLQKMKLRTGKTIGAIPVVMKERVLSIFKQEEQLYLNEIQTLMDELEEWSDCPSARMAGLVDIYGYIDEHCEKFRDLRTFHGSVGKNARVILEDVSRLAPTSDKETLRQMMLVAPILISVIAKLA